MRKKRRKQNLEYQYEIFSKEQLIEVHAEAYYKALKRIEEENKKLVEEEKQNIAITKTGINRKKDKWYKKLPFYINFLIFPWGIIKKENIIKKKFYDNVLLLSVAQIMQLLGSIIWCIGAVLNCTIIYQTYLGGLQLIFCLYISIGLLFLVIGANFIIAGQDFETETDSNKIYAYSASILSLISCMISVFTIIISYRQLYI